MKATMTVQGFDIGSPDKALLDLRHRCQTHAQNGRSEPTQAKVVKGTNPYSVMAVHGYVATAQLIKESAWE